MSTVAVRDPSRTGMRFDFHSPDPVARYHSVTSEPSSLHNDARNTAVLPFDTDTGGVTLRHCGPADTVFVLVSVFVSVFTTGSTLVSVFVSVFVVFGSILVVFFVVFLVFVSV